MNRNLFINGWGAVTPVGLRAAATCAAIRARISRIRDIDAPLPPQEPQRGARVPVGNDLSAAERLVHMAALAVSECLADDLPIPSRTALLLATPEPFRQHPDMAQFAGRDFLTAIEERCGIRFHPCSEELTNGPAAVFHALYRAEELLVSRSVDHCVIGGVDSLVNPADLARLKQANRLHGPDNPQGTLPSEGAALFLVSHDSNGRRYHPLGQILGWGVSQESRSVLGPEFPDGQAMCMALRSATSLTYNESRIDFVTSTFNGERYYAWEAMLYRPRFYKTRRENLPIVYPAMSIGDIGTASAALSIIIAATAIGRGYADGPISMCEATSDEGLRAACLVGAAAAEPAWTSATSRTPARRYQRS